MAPPGPSGFCTCTRAERCSSGVLMDAHESKLKSKTAPADAAAVPDRALGVVEVAALLGKHPQTVRRWIKNGWVDPPLFGVQHLFPPDLVRRILQEGVRAA